MGGVWVKEGEGRGWSLCLAAMTNQLLGVPTTWEQGQGP